MRVVAAVGACVVGVMLVLLLGGCSEDACEKSGYRSSACAKQTRQEEEHACGPGQRVEGFLDCGDREAGERKEFREGWENAEREAEFYGGH